MIIAATPRLIVRHLDERDIPAIVVLWSDPAVTRFMGGPRDPERVAADLREDVGAGAPATFDLWPVIERASAAPVGHCGLLEKEVDGRPVIELVYVIAAGAWGKGYASEAAIAIRDHAFNRLGVRQIVALIDPANTASARVAQKVGLQRAGETLRPSGRSMMVYALQAPV